MVGKVEEVRDPTLLSVNEYKWRQVELKQGAQMLLWSRLTFLWSGRGRDVSMTKRQQTEGNMGVAAEPRNQSGN